MTRPWFLIVLGAIGCGDARAPHAPKPSADPTAGPTAGAGGGEGAAVSPPARPKPPALLPAPRLDLLANQVRFHLHDRGLVIPVGGEGLRLYDLEYRRPWGDAITVDGGRGRVMRGKAATLTAPWPGGAGSIEVRAHGTPSIKISVDGKPAGTVDLSAAGPDGWATGALELPALPAADHRITLTPKQRRAVIASVELIAADDGAGTSCAGNPLPITAIADGALGGWPRMTVMVEVPATGYLVVTPSGGGATAIAARAEGEASDRPLWSGTADGTEQVIDLAPLAGKLIELGFSGGCGVRWKAAAIALAARDLAPAPPRAKNLILVVVDTLRADRVAAMGPTRVATPRLSAAAAAGVAFRHHQSMAPSSPPSHATIQTGQIPRVHGAAGDKQPLDPDAPLLSRVLDDAGFWTGYVGDNDFAMGRLKTAAGWREAHTPTFEGKGMDCAAVFTQAVEMVKTARATGDRYFLSVLPIQPHEPYRYHAGITEKYFAGPFAPPLGKRVTGSHLARIKKLGMNPTRWDQLRGLYDGEVEYLDGCFGILEDGLARLGAADDTAIIVTSDHGEGMGERGGAVGHAYSLNRELISVPLILINTGLPAGETIDTVTSAIDIAPTVLDLLGVPIDPRMQGRSLIPVARDGGGLPQVVASEYGRSYALRGGRWRYLVGYDDRGVLHDVDADPEETHDAGATAPLPLRYLRDAAGLYLAHRSEWRATTWGTLVDLAPGGPLAGP